MRAGTPPVAGAMTPTHSLVSRKNRTMEVPWNMCIIHWYKIQSCKLLFLSNVFCHIQNDLSEVFVAPFAWVALINICDGCIYLSEVLWLIFVTDARSGCKRVIRAPHAHTILAPGLIDSTPLGAKKPLFGIGSGGFFRIFVISVKHILMYSILSWRWSG